jgi:stress-induced morphogen
MAMTAEEIKSMIEEGIPNSEVTIDDLRGDGDHYSANVKSPAFEGISKVLQVQMVYASLKGKMGGELHALQLNTSS